MVALVPADVAKGVGRQALAATAIAARLPWRVSPGRPGPAPLSRITQRRCPERTSMAIQATATELSRPEKPPSPATLAPEARIAAAV